MKKIILLSIVAGSFLFSETKGELENSSKQSRVDQYSFILDSSEDIESEAGRRRGKGNRGRRRGGGGLR